MTDFPRSLGFVECVCRTMYTDEPPTVPGPGRWNDDKCVLCGATRCIGSWRYIPPEVAALWRMGSPLMRIFELATLVRGVLAEEGQHDPYWRELAGRVNKYFEETNRA